MSCLMVGSFDGEGERALLPSAGPIYLMFVTARIEMV